MNEAPRFSVLSGEKIKALEEEFSHPWNPNSQIIGSHLSGHGGLKRTGVSIVRVPPGKESFVYHSHTFEEEWIYILSGDGEAEIDGAPHQVGAGYFMSFPTPSVAHHLINVSKTEDLVYLMGGETKDFEIADFPKLGKRMIRSGAKIDIIDLADLQPFPGSDPI